jgi:hypothetical protein
VISSSRPRFCVRVTQKLHDFAVFILVNIKIFHTEFTLINSAIHSVNTRNRDHIHRSIAKFSPFQRSAYYADIKIFRTLFKKLIVTQFVKKNPAFLWNSKFHLRLHKNPPLDPILCQPNPVCPIDPCLPKVPRNVILSSTPRFSQWSLPFGFPTITL